MLVTEKIKSLLFSQTSRDTLVSFTGLGTIAAVGMIFSIITARGLGPAAFGLFSALTALVTLLSSLGDLGISSALVNFLPKVTDRRSVLISVTFWFQIAVTLVLTLALMAAGLFHNFIIPGSTPQHFITIGVLTGLYVLQGFALGIFNAEKKFLRASILQGSDSIIKLIIVAGLFFSRNLNIELAILANVFSTLVSLIYGFWGEFRNIRPIFPRAQLAEIFQFSKWIALVFALLVSSIGAVTAPRFSAFIRKEDIRRYLKKVALMVGGISLIMLSTVVLADPLVRLIFGEEYLAAIPVFRAMTLAMIPFLLSVITSQPLIYSFNQPKFFSRVTIIQVVTIISLDLIFIPRYQALGPTISLGIANVIVVALSGWKLYRLLK